MRHSQSQDDAFLQLLAEGIIRRGLQSLALSALEAGRPFSLIGGQLLWVAQPGLSLFWKRDQIDQLARILEDPGNVDTLIHYLKSE